MERLVSQGEIDDEEAVGDLRRYYDEEDDPFHSKIDFIQRIYRLLCYLLIIEASCGVYVSTLYGFSPLIGSILFTLLNILLFFCKSCTFPSIRGWQGLNLLQIYFSILSLLQTLDLICVSLFFSTSYGLQSCIKYELKKIQPQFIGSLSYLLRTKQCLEVAEERVWWNCYCYNPQQHLCITVEAYNGDNSTVQEGCGFMIEMIPLLAKLLLFISLLSTLTALSTLL